MVSCKSRTLERAQ